jgi:hypothetical protein
MDTTGLLEIAKYTLPSIIVLAGVYFIMNNFFENEWRRRSVDQQASVEKEKVQITLPIKLQAYERLILFLERINPNSSLHRVRKPGMTSSDLQLALISNIRTEFEHNLAQQLYVSNDAWQLVKSVKEEMIKFYNLLGSKLPKEASEMDYSRAIFDYLMTSNKDLPTDTAIKFLKQDAGRILN